ncbi:hypothetical protein CRG98_019319 [Punica granatum]|uniref:Uncharacterized protein n=1 Tax=Punica granatum TaxID=22663 RepID=A0A2I0JVC0_PUNGR|nr:hypothetical protein CRG98_019319 [Punica granatum]
MEQNVDNLLQVIEQSYEDPHCFVVEPRSVHGEATGIPVSAGKFLHIIHIFEMPDTDHREIEELSSLLVQPVMDAPHGIEQLSSLPFETSEPLVPDQTQPNHSSESDMICHRSRTGLLSFIRETMQGLLLPPPCCPKLGPCIIGPFQIYQ